MTTLRDAVPGDVGAIAAIYAHEVAHGVATFDTVPPPDDVWLCKIESATPGDHCLVGVDPAGAVIGFAYSTTYRPRRAYDATREVSVYLTQSARGLGLGRALYDELLERLADDGVHTVLAVISLPNAASEALHRACGFEPVGVLPEVGFKHGRWIDTAFWALRLREDHLT